MSQYLLAETHPQNLLVDLWRISYQRNAVDIYIRPIAGEVNIHLRVDGKITKVGLLHPTSYQNLLKDLQKENTHHSPVFDAKRSIDMENPIPLRIQVMLTTTGEEIAIRVGKPQEDPQTFEQLGFSADASKLIQKNIQKTGGLTIVTGGIGSGKTTTLYSMLSAVADEHKRIVSIEEPVERDLSRIGQVIQVQALRKNNAPVSSLVNFALRFDPDVLAVGEVHEKQTARHIIEAANTGHQVLATFHASTPVNALKRLANFEVDKYSLSEGINLIISQKLHRKLCTHCRLPYKLHDGSTVYQSNDQGCEECFAQGFKGRALVYEILEIATPEMRQAIWNQDWNSIYKLQDPMHCEPAVRQRLIQEGILPYVPKQQNKLAG